LEHFGCTPFAQRSNYSFNFTHRNEPKMAMILPFSSRYDKVGLKSNKQKKNTH
jgi:hypothetical protein